MKLTIKFCSALLFASLLSLAPGSLGLQASTADPIFQPPPNHVTTIQPLALPDNAVVDHIQPVQSMLVVQTVKPVAAPTAQPTGCGSNPYAHYIYEHESGCDTAAVNSDSGSCGIGQALPCSKLPCSLQDYVCQDRYFSDYAVSRYGGWEQAYNHWLAYSWW